MNPYPICDSRLWRSAQRGFTSLHKSRQNHRSYVWTDALSGVVFVPTQKLSDMAWTLRRTEVARARLLLEALQVVFAKLRIMFCLFSYVTSASQDVIQPTWWTLTRKFLMLPVILIVIAYNRRNLDINCWCWYHHPLMLVWLFNEHEASAILLLIYSHEVWVKVAYDWSTALCLCARENQEQQQQQLYFTWKSLEVIKKGKGSISQHSL